MPCLTFRTARYYLPPRPLSIKESSSDILSEDPDNKGQQLSSYTLFCLKCIGIFLLLNGSHYFTKYIKDSDSAYYYKHHFDSIRSFQSFVAWGLFTALWNIVLSYNINISNNKQKYKKIFSDKSSETYYTHKLQQIKYTKCNLFKKWHIYTTVLFYDCIAFIFLQFIPIPNSLVLVQSNSKFCHKLFICDKFSISHQLNEGFGFCFVFLCSSLTLMLCDKIFCARLQNNYLNLHTNGSSKDDLSTPLVSIPSNTETELGDLMSLHHVEEIIHIQRPSNGTSMRSDSPNLVWSTVPSTTKPSITGVTPIPSSFKNVSYLGNSNTINESCVNIWCLNIFLTFMFFTYFLGVQFVAHWQKELVSAHFEKFVLGLLIYTTIAKYCMTRMGRLYDRLRIFSFSDHNSELNTMIKSKEEQRVSFSETQYFISIELVLYVFVMSVYYVMFRIYLVYYEPSLLSYVLTLLFHISSELLESVRTTRFYYKLMKNVWFLLSFKHKNDICMGKIVGLFRDESDIILWRERFSIDVSVKIVISVLSCIAALLLTVSEYFGNAQFTSHQCAMSALRVGVSAMADLILYVLVYCLWSLRKGYLFEPFTRIITRIWYKRMFVWMFMASFVVAGLTYSGKNI